MVGTIQVFLDNNLVKLLVYDKISYQIKFLLLVGLATVAVVSASAQPQSRVDSLLLAIDQAKGIDKYDPSLELAIVYAPYDNDKALQYARQAFNISRQFGDSVRYITSGRITGQLLNRLDQSREAAELLESLLPVARNRQHREEYRKILNNLALAYTFRAEYDKALRVNFQALVLREEDKDNAGISISYNNIGLVYFKLRNYEKALEFYNRSLKIKRDISDSLDIDRLLINIGLCYDQLGRYQEAQDSFIEAFKACGDNCSDQILVEGHFALGNSYFGLKKNSDALREVHHSYAIAQKLQNKRFEAENLHLMGRVYTNLERPDSAEFFFREAEQIARSSGYNELLLDIYSNISRLYNMTRNFEYAALYQSKYITLKDSIYTGELIQNISRVQTDYAERENKAIIASKEMLIKQQRDLNIAIAVIAILAGLLVLVLQRGNRTIKQVNAQLSEAKEVIESQNKLLETRNKDLDKQVAAKTVDLERLNMSLKQVNDELDNFIYKTSHDIRGPLASLKGMCNVALMDVKDPVALDYLRKLDTTAERLNTILTRLLIINQINNSKLIISRIDFAAVVNDVLLLEKKKGLPHKLVIRRHIEEQASIISDRELVRIVLENLIDNAIKFYNDSDRIESFVDIHVQAQDDGTVKARVIDNGIGISESNPGKLFQMFFRASERSEIGGIGLYIVKTAIAKLGGKVGLLTTPEGYTEFYVIFPSSPPNAEEAADKPALY